MVEYITENKKTSPKLQLAGLGMMLLGGIQLIFSALIIPLFTGLIFLGLGVVLWWDGLVKDHRDERGRRLKRIPDDELPAQYRRNEKEHNNNGE